MPSCGLTSLLGITPTTVFMFPYNILDYFPPILILDIVLMQFLIVQAGKIFESYVESLTMLYENQNKMVNYNLNIPIR